MIQTVCSHGHYYDASKNSSCPYCKTDFDASYQYETTPFRAVAADEDSTMPINSASSGLGGEYAETVPSGGSTTTAIDGDETLPFYGAENEEIVKSKKSPVVGWLVCKSGNHFGKDFSLYFGQNYIGRNSNMDVALTNEDTVSHDKHAVIIYEPKQNEFFVHMGSSKGLVYLNGSLVSQLTLLKRYDVISVGRVNLVFIPLCDENFRWDNIMAE